MSKDAPSTISMRLTVSAGIRCKIDLASDDFDEGRRPLIRIFSEAWPNPLSPPSPPCNINPGNCDTISKAVLGLTKSK